MWVGLLIALTVGHAADPELVDAVVFELSPRDPIDACAAVAALGPEDAVAEALIAVADTVARPPWVPVRAAGCVAARADASGASRRAAARWLDDPETPGLGLAVLRQADMVAEATAVEWADSALGDPGRSARFDVYAREILGRCRHEGVVWRVRPDDSPSP